MIYAIAPRHTAEVIHLYVEGYLPRGRQLVRQKRRSVDKPLCPAYVPGIAQARKVPLKEALRWPEHVPTAEDMRPRRRWCPSCLGHAADLLGLADNLARALAWEQEISSSHGSRVQGQMVTWAQNTGSSAPSVTGGMPVGPIT